MLTKNYLFVPRCARSCQFFWASVFLLMSIPSQGQITQLFSDTTLSDNQLTFGQAARKNAILEWPKTESMQYVRVGDLSQIQQDGFLNLQIPGDTTIYLFSAEHVVSDSTGNYTWAGNLISPIPCAADSTDEPECASGSMILIRRGASKYGMLQIDDDTEIKKYEIKDLGSGLNAIVKLANDSLPDSDCISTARGGEEIDSVAIDLNSNCPVRVLAFYTDSAIAKYPDVLNIIELCVESMNAGIKNSQIDENLLKIVLAGKEPLNSTDFVESGSSFIDFDVKSLLTISYINDKKAEYNADVVVVFTDDSYTTAAGAVAAFGDELDDRDSAYAIVSTGSSLSNLTFAHEMGHLFGARHEIRGSDCGSAGTTADDGLPHSHGWVIVKRGWVPGIYSVRWFRRTIMATCPVGPRILNYSNPYVEYKGLRTGSELTNYNAKTLAFAACRVSRYVTTEEPSVYIVAPRTLCPGDETGIEGVVSGVSAPIFYYWQTSYDGFNFSPEPASASSSKYFTATAPATAGASVYVRLTAGSSGGPFVTTTKRILAEESDDPPCDPYQYRLTLANNTHFTTPTLLLYPNPATDEVTLRLKDGGITTYEISIFDILGREVQKFKGGTQNPRIDDISMDISLLPSGNYWLSFRSKEISTILTFSCLMH